MKTKYRFSPAFFVQWIRELNPRLFEILSYWITLTQDKYSNKFQENLDTIRSKINEQNINFYIDFIVNSLFEANKYFNDQEPWKKKDNLIRLNTIVYTTLEIVRKISFLLYPIIPETSLKALKIFNLSEKDIKLETISNNEFIIKGNMINKIDILIKKIEKENDWLTLPSRSWTAT